MASPERSHTLNQNLAQRTPSRELQFSANFLPLDIQREGPSREDKDFSNNGIPTFETKLVDIFAGQEGHISTRVAAGFGLGGLALGAGGVLLYDRVFGAEPTPETRDINTIGSNSFTNDALVSTPEPTLTPTLSPTPTPEPTETPVPPTPIAEPTPTRIPPTPTAIPTRVSPTETPISPTATPEPTPIPKIEYGVWPVVFASSNTVIDPEDIGNVNNVMKEIQQWLAKQLDGKTIEIEPAVLVLGNHDKEFYCPNALSENQCVHDPGKPGANPAEAIERVISDLKTQKPALFEKGKVVVIFWADGSGYAAGRQDSPDHGTALVGELELDAFRKRYNRGTYRGECGEFTYSIVYCRADPRRTAHETFHGLGLGHPIDDNSRKGDANFRELSVMDLCEWSECKLLDSNTNPEKKKLLQSRFMHVVLNAKK